MRKRIDKLTAWNTVVVGANGGQKVSPEQAEILMKQVGTQEGANSYPSYDYMKMTTNEPRFNVLELLTCFQLKSYCSKPSSQIRKAIDKLIEKANQGSSPQNNIDNLEIEEILKIDQS